MTTRGIIILFGLLAVFGAAAFYLIATEPAVTQEAKKEVWTCPMHPQVTSDKPGTCPICEMQLEKKEGTL